MSKKFLCFLICLLLITAVGCGEKGGSISVEKGDEPESSASQAPAPVVVLNPLTGLSGFDASKISTRPVAIMINNISIAQPVQTGLGSADIIYETEVEGGITRLMAVYQDLSKAGQIGTVRSARYPYVDLAMGHNAIYVHCGQDAVYCGPHLKDTDDFSLSDGGNNFGTRIKNGLASEHTLYTFGDNLWKGLATKGWEINSDKTGSWVDFADESESISLTGGTAASVSVSFSTSYNSTFNYDAATGRYTRLSNGRVLNDYKLGTPTTVKNVFVLTTTITDYSDNYHRQVALVGGDGYYCVNGTRTQIKWQKGKASDGFVFTNADGTPLKVNAGNSWVCISDMNTSQPVFQ